MKPEDVAVELAESLARLLWQVDDNRGELHDLIPDARTWLAANLPAHKAQVLREFADLIDRGPAVPLTPSIYSTLAREKADHAARGDQ